MKSFSKIGSGKVLGYETDDIASWEDALDRWDKNEIEHQESSENLFINKITNEND